MTDPHAPTWEPLLTEARARVARFTERDESGPLLDSDALDLAERLWTEARDADQAVPLPVAVAVADLYWWRYRAGGSHSDDDLGAALALFSMIEEAAPGSAPDAVQQLLTALTEAPIGVEAELAAAVDALVAAEAGTDPSVLDDAIARFGVLRADLDLAPDVDTEIRQIVLSNLGLALRLRGERDGTTSDLDAAVALTCAALDLPNHHYDDRGALLGNAAIAYGTRFASTGAAADLDEAVTLGSQAVAATAVEDPAWPGRASNLSGLHRIRFDRTRAQADLDQAIALSTWAAELTSDDLRVAGLRWSNVSNAIAARYDVGRSDDDLARAIDAGRRAVAATPADDRTRGAVLVNLANLVLTRFEQWGAAGDLDQAIDLGEEALRDGGLGGPALAGLLSNLGNAYRSRFEHDPAPADLDRSVELSGRSLDLTAEVDPQRASRLSNHAMSMLTRYERSGDNTDLAAALTAGRNAVIVAGPVHPGRSKFLSNVAVILAAQAATLDVPARLATLDAAVCSGQAALATLAPSDTDGPIRMLNLAGALLDRSRVRIDPTDRLTAIDLYAQVAGTVTAPTSIRVRAARSWGATEAAVGRWPAAAQGYATAVRLLDRLAARRIGRRDREDLLGQFALLAGDASAAALAVGRPSDAVALLEQGRSVLWTQALDGAATTTRIGADRPDLADRLNAIAGALG